MSFKSLGGVKKYRHGTCTLHISLPGQAQCCNYCEMLRYNEAFKRYRCAAVREENYVLDPCSGIPEWCPVKWENWGEEHA